MKDLGILNPENASQAEVEKFEVRTAVRAVVFDNEKNVAILNVSKEKYHKLPGGGAESGEEIEAALKRECKEELGCDVQVIGELGQIVEYRKMLNQKQISPCFLAKVVGEKGNPAFTEEEAEEGFEIMWLPIDKALAILEHDQPLNNEGRLYIVPRDRMFLELASQNRV